MSFFQLENLNTADSSSEHILTVIEAFYQAENQARSDNIKLSLRNSAATGKSKNYTRPCYGLQRDEHGELTVNEADAANISSYSTLISRVPLSSKSSTY